MSKPQQITVLGATGSVGLSTLDVIGRHPSRYQVFALTGYTRLAELLALCVRHTPTFAVVPTAVAARQLQDDLRAAGLDTRVLVGEGGLCEVSAHPQVDTVLAAIVGAAGLRLTPSAVTSGQLGQLVTIEALVISCCSFSDPAHHRCRLLLLRVSVHDPIFQ